MEDRRPMVIALIVALIWVWATPAIQEPTKIIPIPIIKARTKATMEEKRANKQMAKEFAWAGYGWRGGQWACIEKLFTAESRFDHFAKNKKSTAYGIGQVLSEKSSDPAIQILRAYNYIRYRYDTPCRAWSWHKRTGHY